MAGNKTQKPTHTDVPNTAAKKKPTAVTLEMVVEKLHEHGIHVTPPVEPVEDDEKE